MLFLGSPLVRSLYDLEVRSMKFSEIPIHDVTRDMILMDHSNIVGYSATYMGIRDAKSKNLITNQSKNPNGLGLDFTDGGNSNRKRNNEKYVIRPLNSAIANANKERLRLHPIVRMYASTAPGQLFESDDGSFNGMSDVNLLKHLFLPIGIANMIKNGQIYNARMLELKNSVNFFYFDLMRVIIFIKEIHENVCVLFADICQFNKFAVSVGPNIWVKKLNEIYMEYEKLTNLYQVFHVSFIKKN